MGDLGMCFGNSTSRLVDVREESRRGIGRMELALWVRKMAVGGSFESRESVGRAPEASLGVRGVGGFWCMSPEAGDGLEAS